jgi:hypothetical protein
LQLDGPLAADRAYEVRVAEATLSFRTSAGADERAPALAPTSVLIEGACVAVRVLADEAVTVELRDEHGQPLAASDIAGLETELAARAPGIAGIIVVAADAAGNLAGARLDVTTPAVPPALVITEVLAHPRGAQPAEEWVEVHNVGAASVGTGGLSIAAGGGHDALPAGLVPAGGYALVVGAGYDPTDGLDVPPAAGAAVLRLSSATIGAGLPNGAGDPVELLDAHGLIVSRYGGYLDLSARAAAGTSAARVAADACDARPAWRKADPPTPGGPN